MSVATEFPPVVLIPDRARCGAPRSVRHLRLIEAPQRVAVEAVAVEPVAHPQAHLTRRGQWVMWAVTGVLAAALLLGGYLSAGGAERPTARPVPAAVTVQTGDTLWTIAAATFPARDPRVVVDHLMAVNHLASATIQPGQTLKVK